MCGELRWTGLVQLHGTKRWFLLSTELMMERHGFPSTLLGRRTRSFGRGGSRIGATFVEAPFPAILAAGDYEL